jgi:hypothetical protein
MTEPTKPTPPTLSDLPAPSILITTEKTSVPHAAKPAVNVPGDMTIARIIGTEDHDKRSFSMETSDIIAIGVVILAIGAVLVAIIISIGFAFGKVPGNEATEIILGCVSGSAISGVVAALLGAKSKPRGKTS